MCMYKDDDPKEFRRHVNIASDGSLETRRKGCLSDGEHDQMDVACLSKSTKDVCDVHHIVSSCVINTRCSEEVELELNIGKP